MTNSIFVPVLPAASPADPDVPRLTLAERLKERIKREKERYQRCSSGTYRALILLDQVRAERALKSIGIAKRRAKRGDWRAVAYLALVAECDAQNAPRHYELDVADHDLNRLYDIDPAAPIPFVWILRDYGSHLYPADGDPNRWGWARSVHRVMGKESRWYWYDPATTYLERIDGDEGLRRLAERHTRELTPKERHFFRPID